MKIMVIDGMGGGMGKSIIEQIKSELPGVEIVAVGTNSLATSAMLKAGADCGATGENAVVFNSAGAEYIIGVMGIVIANSMHGEISPKMAEAVSASPAQKILIPIDKCSVTVAGVSDKPAQALIREVVQNLSRNG